MRVYLAGEIHSDWRDEIAAACQGLDVSFDGPVTDHAASDDCGVAILGGEDDKFWHDRKGALVNAIRTSHALKQADVVVVRFGDKYKQWNAAFDAGQAVAMGKPLIVLQPPEHDHALKEVDAAAQAVCRTPGQVAQVLRYVLRGQLPLGGFFRAGFPPTPPHRCARLNRSGRGCYGPFAPPGGP